MTINKGIFAFRLGLIVIGGLLTGLAVASSWSGTGSFLGVTLPQVIVLILGIALIAYGVFTPSNRLWAHIQRYKLNRIVIAVFAILSIVILLEVAANLLATQLNTAELQTGAASLADYEPDPILGRRIVPNSPGHDANGFRNASVPDHADIVTLGDSQTWGNQATINDNWPAALAKQSGMSVYNMGIDGYGPVEDSALMDQALKFSPKVVVIGYYFGADIYFAYNAAYTRTAFASLRDPNFKPLPAPLAETVNATTVTRQGNDLSSQIIHSETPGWLLWSGTNTAIGRFFSFQSSWPGYTIDDNFRAWTETIKQLPNFGIAYDHDNVRTIMTSASRVTNVDRNDPTIVEGLRISKAMLLKIQAQAASKNAQVIVLLLPTKELVYADKVASYGQGVDTYNMQVQMESADRDEIKTFSQQNNLPVADPLPLMRDAAAKGQAIYAVGTDGHPVAAGYALIAQSVNATLNGITPKIH